MRFCIVCYSYGIFLGSMTRDLLSILAEGGHKVDVYADDVSINYCNPGLLHENLALNIFCNNGRLKIFNRIQNFLLKYEKALLLAPMRFQLVLFSPNLWRFSRWLRRKIFDIKYDVVIAIEAQSLVSLQNCDISPLYYMDLELLNDESGSWIFPGKILLKSMQRQLLLKIRGVLITSPARRDIFARDNHFPRERVNVLPVVPRGGDVVPETFFFHNKFTLPSDTRIVLHAGHLVPWTKVHEVIDGMSSWPDNTALVIHTWRKDLVDKKYLNELESRAKGYPVYFSFEDIPASRKINVWASADVGLAFYEDIDENFSEILFSSNKFGEYVKAGLPVLCSKQKNLADFVKKCNIGFSVDPGNLGDELRVIFSQYDVLKKNLSYCYEEHFVLDKYVHKFLDSF